MKVGRTPSEAFPALFERVQIERLFPDSKSFVDAVALADPESINADFERCRRLPAFDLQRFVQDRFRLPAAPEVPSSRSPGDPITAHVESLWKSLSRPADDCRQRSSLIPLPHSYVVPGGRFREIYYWDSYFTMLGLVESGRIDRVRDMVDNFAYLIDEIGFIPNGNRTYFCSRSQPPYFSLMVALLDSVSEERGVGVRYLPQLLREHAFWMAGTDELGGRTTAHRRVVAVGDGYLNRYWDDVAEPRDESYAEDLALARRSGRVSSELYRDLRAGCESGWDFSSRWLEDQALLETICTTRIVPVDLNSLMFHLEHTIATYLEDACRPELATTFHRKAEQRKKLLQGMFFDAMEGLFVDLMLPDLRPSRGLSLAAVYPMSFGIATAEQGRQVAGRLRADFLAAGGWLTTLNHSGQQWDSPNGWAPLQWTVFDALCRYGFAELAGEGARRWVDNVSNTFRASSRLFEKYNVSSLGDAAEGGEYEIQDGFGWTNGVLLRLLRELRSPSAP